MEVVKNIRLSDRTDYIFQKKQQDRLQRKLKVIFNRQLKYIVKEAEGIEELNTNNLFDKIDEMLKKMPGRKEIVDAIMFYIRSSMKKGGRTLARETGIDVDFNLENREATRYLRARQDFELSDFSGNIDDVTKKRIKQILVQAAQSGQSYDETAEQIKAQGDNGVFSLNRGQLIAVREIGLAYEKGKRFTINEFKGKFPDREVLKRWQTVEDDRVTPQCSANQKKGWRDLTYEWIGTGQDSDQEAPRDSNPRCRCFTQYDIPKPK